LTLELNSSTILVIKFKITERQNANDLCGKR
jgi:hypothetical protein